MSVFELIMLACFALSWPFSIYRSWRSRSARGKSVPMLVALQIGYVSGILHKVFYSPDPVVVLYVFNLLMISTDLVLTLRNKRLDARHDQELEKQVA